MGRAALSLAALIVLGCGSDSDATQPEPQAPAFSVEGDIDIALGCLLTWSAKANQPLRLVNYRVGIGTNPNPVRWQYSGQFQGTVKVTMGRVTSGGNSFVEWEFTADGYKRTQRDLISGC